MCIFSNPPPFSSNFSYPLRFRARSLLCTHVRPFGLYKYSYQPAHTSPPSPGPHPTRPPRPPTRSHPTPPGRVKGGDCRGTASGEIGDRGGAPRPGHEGSEPAVRTERVPAAAPTQVRPSGVRRRRAAPARQLPYPRRWTPAAGRMPGT